MSKRKAHHLFSTTFMLCVTGLSIGWLTGLSASPVVSTLIASIMGSAAAIAAALSGIDNNASHQENERRITTASLRSRA